MTHVITNDQLVFAAERLRFLANSKPILTLKEKIARRAMLNQAARYEAMVARDMANPYKAGPVGAR